MGHLTAKERWGTVDLDTTTGRIFVQEDWYYAWSLFPPVTQSWTHAEKQHFHHLADNWIWRVWSNHLHLKVIGNAPFPSRRVPVNFDIRWRTHLPANWTVLAWKVPPGSTPTNPIRSSVDWDNYIINLSSSDTGESDAGNDGGQSTKKFVTAPHEFGHTMRLPDEYNAGAPHLFDDHSIMNIGRIVKGRHLIELTKTLNKMLPGVRFTA